MKDKLLEPEIFLKDNISEQETLISVKQTILKQNQAAQKAILANLNELLNTVENLAETQTQDTNKIQT